MTISASQKSTHTPQPARPDIIRPGPDGVTIWENHTPLGYDEAVATMKNHITAMQSGAAPEVLWFLEHHPVYTGGSSARDDELLLSPDHHIPNPSHSPSHSSSDMKPIIRATGRGGQWTYHAPGQRIVYIMLDLNRRGRDIRAFVRGIEAWGISSLAQCGITGMRRAGAPGIWVYGDNKDNNRSDQPDHKIAAIGVRLSRWISWHGIAINVAADMLDGFRHIIPCGIHDAGVTACAHMINQPADMIMQQLDHALINQFSGTLGRYTDTDIATIAPSQNSE